MDEKQTPKTWKECENLDCENCTYYPENEFSYYDYHLMCRVAPTFLNKICIKDSE
jgi:hypothetical protein